MPPVPAPTSSVCIVRLNALVCDSVSLKQVVAMLNLAYDAHVEIGRPELNDLPLTTVFHHEPLEKILAIIGATFDLKVVRQGNSIILQ